MMDVVIDTATRGGGRIRTKAVVNREDDQQQQQQQQHEDDVGSIKVSLLQQLKSRMTGNHTSNNHKKRNIGQPLQAKQDDIPLVIPRRLRSPVPSAHNRKSFTKNFQTASTSLLDDDNDDEDDSSSFLVDSITSFLSPRDSSSLTTTKMLQERFQDSISSIHSQDLQPNRPARRTSDSYQSPIAISPSKQKPTNPGVPDKTLQQPQQLFQDSVSSIQSCDIVPNLPERRISDSLHGIEEEDSIMASVVSSSTTRTTRVSILQDPLQNSITSIPSPDLQPNVRSRRTGDIATTTNTTITDEQQPSMQQLDQEQHQHRLLQESLSSIQSYDLVPNLPTRQISDTTTAIIMEQSPTISSAIGTTTTTCDTMPNPPKRMISQDSNCLFDEDGITAATQDVVPNLPKRMLSQDSYWLEGEDEDKSLPLVQPKCMKKDDIVPNPPKRILSQDSYLFDNDENENEKMNVSNLPTKKNTKDCKDDSIPNPPKRIISQDGITFDETSSNAMDDISASMASMTTATNDESHYSDTVTMATNDSSTIHCPMHNSNNDFDDDPLVRYKNSNKRAASDSYIGALLSSEDVPNDRLPSVPRRRSTTSLRHDKDIMDTNSIVSSSVNTDSASMEQQLSPSKYPYHHADDPNDRRISAADDFSYILSPTSTITSTTKNVSSSSRLLNQNSFDSSTIQSVPSQRPSLHACEEYNPTKVGIPAPKRRSTKIIPTADIAMAVSSSSILSSSASDSMSTTKPPLPPPPIPSSSPVTRIQSFDASTIQSIPSQRPSLESSTEKAAAWGEEHDLSPAAPQRRPTSVQRQDITKAITSMESLSIASSSISTTRPQPPIPSSSLVGREQSFDASTIQSCPSQQQRPSLESSEHALASGLQNDFEPTAPRRRPTNVNGQDIEVAILSMGTSSLASESVSIATDTLSPPRAGDASRLSIVSGITDPTAFDMLSIHELSDESSSDDDDDNSMQLASTIASSEKASITGSSIGSSSLRGVNRRAASDSYLMTSKPHNLPPMSVSRHSSLEGRATSSISQVQRPSMESSSKDAAAIFAGPSMPTRRATQIANPDDIAMAVGSIASTSSAASNSMSTTTESPRPSQEQPNPLIPDDDDDHEKADEQSRHDDNNDNDGDSIVGGDSGSSVISGLTDPTGFDLMAIDDMEETSNSEHDSVEPPSSTTSSSQAAGTVRTKRSKDDGDSMGSSLAPSIPNQTTTIDMTDEEAIPPMNPTPEYISAEPVIDMKKLPSALMKLGYKFRTGMKVSTHHFHFKKYENCFVGSEAVDYMIAERMAYTREDAVFLGQRFMKEMKLFHHVCWDHLFKDSLLFYRFTEMEDMMSLSATNSTRSGNTTATSTASTLQISNKTHSFLSDVSMPSLSLSWSRSSGSRSSGSGSRSSGSSSQPEGSCLSEIAVGTNCSNSSGSCSNGSATCDGSDDSRKLPDLKSIALVFKQNVRVGTHIYHFMRYKKTFVGKEAVDFLVKSRLAYSREDAVFLGQRLMDELDLFHHVKYEHTFKDGYLFYSYTNESTGLSNNSEDLASFESSHASSSASMSLSASSSSNASPIMAGSSRCWDDHGDIANPKAIETPRVPLRNKSIVIRPSTCSSAFSVGTASTSSWGVGFEGGDYTRKTSTVTFGNIETRVFERILEVHPSTLSGPSVGLGWNYKDAPVVKVPNAKSKSSDDQRFKRTSDFILSKQEREAILHDLGYNDREINKAVRRNRKVRDQRRETLNKLTAKSSANEKRRENQNHSINSNTTTATTNNKTKKGRGLLNMRRKQ